MLCVYRNKALNNVKIDHNTGNSIIYLFLKLVQIEKQFKTIRTKNLILKIVQFMNNSSDFKKIHFFLNLNRQFKYCKLGL